MKKSFLYICIIALVVLVSVYLFLINNQKSAPVNNQKQKSVSISQGLRGQVTMNSGNCMPSAGYEQSSCQKSYIARKIYIRKPVVSEAMDGAYLKDRKDRTELIKQAESNSDGTYQVELPAGTYSIFVEEDGKEYCNLSDGQGGICQVTIGSGITEYNLTIDNAVW